MKRISILLVMVFILNMLVCLNGYGAGALPVVKDSGTWEVLLSEDFEASTPTYFTKLLGSQGGRTYVNDDENTVVDLKLGEKYTADSSKPGYNYYYNNVRIGQGSQSSDVLATNKTLGEKYMIEFDLCGKI